MTSLNYSLSCFFAGVPGVKPERFAEGFSIQHCALSLVGEPIMYPEINEFIQMLHERVRLSQLCTSISPYYLHKNHRRVNIDIVIWDSRCRCIPPFFQVLVLTF